MNAKTRAAGTSPQPAQPTPCFRRVCNAMRGVLALFVVPLVACLLTPPAAAVEYFVGVDHPNASDSNDGLSPDLPFETLSRAVQPLVPGDTLSIMEGIYREKLDVGVTGTAISPVVIRAYPGDEGTVVIRGSDVVTGWTHDGGDVWSVPWQPLPLWNYPLSYPGVDEYARRREMVFIDGDPLLQVLSPTELASGRFWMDDGAGRIRIHYQGDPNDVLVEIAVRTEGAMARGRDYVVFRGLRVEHVTTELFIGAMALGPYAWVEDCRVEHNNGSGIEAYTDSVIMRTISNHNGRLGIGLSGNNSLLDSSETSYNSWRYGPGFAAGGIKVAASNMPSGIRIVRHTSSHNNGPGIAFDTIGSGNVVEASVLEGNAFAGIVFEAAIGPNWAINNIVDGTVKANDGTSPNFDGAGISTLVARDIFIFNNTIVDVSGNGIVIGGGTRDEGMFYTANDQVFNNIIVNPAGVAVRFQVWGFSAEPAQIQSHVFDNNLYFDADPAIYYIGNFWSLAQWQQNRGQDLHSLYAPPMFTNSESRNYSLLEGSPAIDAGQDLVDVSHDIVGCRRPYGAHSDIGAFERSGHFCYPEAVSVLASYVGPPPLEWKLTN